MNIAYIRFNNSIELDYMYGSISTKGTDRRIGILRALEKQGHTVNIYSPVKDERVFTNNSLFSDPSDIMPQNLNYKFPDYPSDEDVLLIENGTTNTLFSFKIDNRDKPYIKHVFDIIDKWSGPVTYLQWDAELPFPFGLQDLTPTPNVDNNNITLMGSKIDFFENKDWKIVTTALNTEELKKKNPGNRFQYPKYAEKIQGIPLCYDEDIDIVRDPLEEPKSTITYVGSESDKYRNTLLSKYINNPNNLLYGNWSPEIIKKYLPNITYKGIFKGHGKVYNLYNKSYIGVQCGERKWSSLDHMSSRFFQILGGGAIPILIDNYSNKFLDIYLGDKKELNVKNKKDFNRLTQTISESSADERKKLISKIFEHNTQWKDLNWSSLLR